MSRFEEKLPVELDFFSRDNEAVSAFKMTRRYYSIYYIL